MNIAEMIGNLQDESEIEFIDPDETRNIVRKSNGTYAVYDDAMSLDDVMLIEDGLTYKDCLLFIYNQGNFDKQATIR